jgi:flagellar protein FliS
MNTSARDAYLASEILSATPQKLRLMLIVGAIRFAGLTLDHWQAERNDEAYQALARCRSIVTELLSGIQDGPTGVAKKLRGVYLFLFRSLTEAQLRRDVEKVQEVLRVLHVERETWEEICRAMPEAPEAAPSSPAEVTAGSAAAILPTSVFGPGSSHAPSAGGFDCTG